MIKGGHQEDNVTEELTLEKQGRGEDCRKEDGRGSGEKVGPVSAPGKGHRKRLALRLLRAKGIEKG